jgi:hypothetical protein
MTAITVTVLAELREVLRAYLAQLLPVERVDEYGTVLAHVDLDQAPRRRWDRTAPNFISISSRAMAVSSRSRLHNHFICRLPIARSLATRSPLSAKR